MSTHYEILNIQKDASHNDIKKAYHKLAVKHHPDKGGDVNKFKEISGAYETLSNPEKKKQYDDFGSINTDIGLNAMDIFNQFETMFQNDIFGPNRVGAPPFGGFTFPNQTSAPPPLSNIFMSMAPMNNGCFTQTIIIQNGKKITTSNSNGKTTVTEEMIRPTTRLS